MLTEGETTRRQLIPKTAKLKARYETVTVPAPLTVERVAEWLNCSIGNVQGLESGRGTLTWENALLFSNQTAANIAYLLSGNPGNPIDWYGNPYTQKIFEQQQVELKRRKQDRKFAAHLVQVNFAKATAIVAATLLRAFQDGKDDVVPLRLIEALKSVYFDVNKTGIDRNGLVGSFMAGHHKTTRPDLKPTLDAWEAHFQKILPQRPQAKARPAKATGKAAKQPASKPAAARSRHAKRNQRR
jgi:hypothetical protein